MIDDKTPHAALPLPHRDNYLDEDVDRLRAALTTIDALLQAADEVRSALAAQLETGLAENARAAAAAQTTADSALAAATAAQSTADSALNMGRDWAAQKPELEQRLAALEGLLARSDQAPQATDKLWLNTENDTLNYHDGTAWKSLVGRYADA